MTPTAVSTKAFGRGNAEETMPLNAKGKKIKAAMEKDYGKDKGDRVFYASENKGTIKGVTATKKKGKK